MPDHFQTIRVARKSFLAFAAAIGAVTKKEIGIGLAITFVRRWSLAGRYGLERALAHVAEAHAVGKAIILAQFRLGASLLNNRDRKPTLGANPIALAPTPSNR